MAQQLIEVARRVVEGLEAVDVEAVRPGLAESLADWDPRPWIADRWRPRLDELAGADRRLTDVRQVNAGMARATFAGSRGRAFVSVLVDGAGLVAGLAVDEDERDGQLWLVISCPEEREDELERFYRAFTTGRLGFGEGGALAPRWGDPTRPTQVHLDIAVADLDAAERRVLDLGADALERFPGWRVYADPVGHPFCLYPEVAEPTEPTDRIGRLQRIVFDCLEPAVLGDFWSGLLGMARRVESTAERVVVAGDPADPMIACQRIPDHQPPRWPDPAFPAQMHLDLGFDDRVATERRALELGAVRLPAQGGSCPVYADPAGHPFCLCSKGE